MLTLYGQVASRAIRPLWMLEELGLPYTFEPVAPRSPEALAVSPTGKIPVLRTDEGTLIDSVAIMTWLTDHEGRFTHPAGSFARAQQDGLTQTILETFDAILCEMAKNRFVLPKEHRVPEADASLQWQFARHAAQMAEILGDGPCLMGDDPMLPDFLLAHCCAWAAGNKLPLPDPLREHMNRMRARPAFRRAMAKGEA